MLRSEFRALLQVMPQGLKDRVAFFRGQPTNKQGFFLLEMNGALREAVLARLRNDEVTALLHYLDPDEATLILHHVGHHRRAVILEALAEDIKGKVEFLLKFNPKSAAGMMSLDYIEVARSMRLKEVDAIIRRHERATGKFPTILVVHDGFLAGELPGHLLLLRKPGDIVGNHTRSVPHIRYDAAQKEVVKLFRHHPHDKVVVLDDEDSILGVIYSDDLLRSMENQEAVTLADFAGVSHEEDVLDSAFSKLRRRSRWLIINLCTAFLVALVVALFEETLRSFVLLAAYMPVVAAMGTSSGTQTLAVLVRGLALHEVTPATARRIIMAEMTVGALNGVIAGLLVSLVAFLWNQSLALGFILFVTFFFTLFLAGLFGAVIPLVMLRLGKDPATSSAIFIGTMTDVIGFLFLLWLASVVL